ncbi:hypothetical protein SAV31267_047280 [Streptomyces avermitilis]|uniref:Uncharacterized protein n=1 Tax=Streptomyces avermitilis TaxID=33903 RepID=A0A4D4MSX6_STRAX|nr:hypothetical protein SAV31267_047280 [Streptomyces avermitilis]
MTHAFTIPAPSVEDPEGPPGGGARRTGAARRLPTTAAAALGLFAAARLCGFLVLAAVAWASGKSPCGCWGTPGTPSGT